MYCSDFKQDNLAHKALDESEYWRIFHRKVARKAPEAGELSINPKIQENVRITVNYLLTGTNDVFIAVRLQR